MAGDSEALHITIGGEKAPATPQSGIAPGSDY